jgi:hypothetical protein
MNPANPKPTASAGQQFQQQQMRRLKQALQDRVETHDDPLTESSGWKKRSRDFWASACVTIPSLAPRPQ